MLQNKNRIKKYVGLNNQGATCYMNSAIQCLSHVKALTNYFLRGLYVDEINKNNPLGSQGAITSAFAKVIW